MPVVSGILVFHRDTPFLRPAIASVLAQTLTDLELVLVDNGLGLSSDSLGELARDRRVTWVRLPRNEGIPGGHNAGVTVARGDFIALLDYDDRALPSRFERQVELMHSRPEFGLVSSLAETIDDHGMVVGREFALGDHEEQYAYLQFSTPVVTPAYTGRREIFRRFPYRPEFMWAADFDFLARAAEATRLTAVPEVLLQYRRYSGQTTMTQAVEIEEQRAAIRTLTARRRAGRPEELFATSRQIEAPKSPAASCLQWARRNLAEGFFALAAYHVRRALAVDRSPVRATVGCALAGRAMLAARGAERRLAARLFFNGPVRALRLNPRGRDSGGPPCV